MHNPVVSIITPSYNRADIIGETAVSIFNQTYSHWEWIIVDDGSTDNSLQLLESYTAKDKRVKYFKRDREPKGAAVCRNLAVEKCEGEYLIFLDTDDLLANFCLQQRIDAVKENPEAEFIIFPMLMFSKQPDDLKLLWNVETGENELARVLRSDPVCQGTGTIWKKTSFKKIGMWKEDLAVWQDVELHIRSFVNGLNFVKRMELLPDVFIRISEVSLSRTGYDSIQKVKSRISVFNYALNEIDLINENKQVNDAIKIMGFNLTAGAIRSGHFREAGKLISLCEKFKVFEKGESRIFKNYLLFRKYKGYKLAFADQYFYKKIERVIPVANQSVGKIQYTGKISL